MLNYRRDALLSELCFAIECYSQNGAELLGASDLLRTAPSEAEAAPLTPARLRSLWRELEARTGNPAIALALGAQGRPAVGLATLAAMTAPTLGAGLTALVRYWPINRHSSRMVLQPLHRELRMEVRQGPEVDSRHMSEYRLAWLIGFIRWITAREIVPDYVLFKHSSPKHLAAYFRIFAAPCQFHHDTDQMVFQNTVLETPLVEHNPELHDLLCRQAEAHLQGSDSGLRLRDEVAQRLHALLESGEQVLEATAAGLDMSPRTLQRRLRTEGTTFRELVDQVRRESCLHQLRNPSSNLDDIAHRLGYTDRANFSRAFRRWSGTSPARYRREADRHTTERA